MTPVRNREHRSSVASLGTSFDPMTSPIRLLRPPQPGEPRTHTAAPSVDITAEQARSPLVQSHMPRSMMSDQAELGTSAQTLVSSSASRGRGHGRGHSLSLVPDPGKDVAVSPGFDMPGSQVSGQGTSMSASLSELGALGSLKLAQARAAVAGLAGVREGQVEHHKRADSDAGNIASALGHKDATSRRHSTVGVPASGSGSHWLRTLSSAWASFRGGPSAASASADTPTFEDSPNAGTAASSRRGSVGGPRPTPAAPTGRPRPASTHSGDSLSSRRLSSVSPAGASLAAALAAMDGDGPTPTQSLVVRPSLRRSSMPSFDHDATSRNMARSRSGVDAPSLAAGENVTVTNGEMMSNVDAPSLAAAHEQVEEERRRRRLEKERALRHRRSKDVHILPPLLAPRPSGSNLNLTSPLPPRSARSTSHSHSRTRAGSGAYNVPPMYVGSAGNSAASAMPPPSSHAHVPPSPSHRPNLLRSPRSQTFNPFADGGFSPSRAGLPVPGTPGFWSGPPSAGTSPRRAGLGWGAIPSATHGADSNAHGNSSSLSYGHAAALASHHAHGPYGHAAHGYGQPHGPHGHGHRHHHHHHHSYGTPASARGGLHHYSSQLALGAHPHGHAQVYNRHATMPVLAGYSRSGTPSVPEDGAAMSTEAFLAPSPVHSRPASALGYRSPSVVGPPRPRSVVGMYSSGAPPVPESETSDHPGPLPAPAPRYAPIGGPGLHGNDRTWSWDNLPGLKTYPVLQLPGRETHDRYDEGWGLGEGGLEEVLTGRPKSRAAAPGAAAAAAGSSDPAQGQGQGGTGPGVEPRSGRVEAGREAASRQSTHRKKLFYFDN